MYISFPFISIPSPYSFSYIKMVLLSSRLMKLVQICNANIKQLLVEYIIYLSYFLGLFCFGGPLGNEGLAIYCR